MSASNPREAALFDAGAAWATATTDRRGYDDALRQAVALADREVVGSDDDDWDDAMDARIARLADAAGVPRGGWEVVIDDVTRRLGEGSGDDPGRELAEETEGVRVAAARWQDAHELSGALGLATGDLHWHELIERVRALATPTAPTSPAVTREAVIEAVRKELQVQRWHGQLIADRLGLTAGGHDRG